MSGILTSPELVDMRAFRHRENVNTFETLVVRIVKFLIDRSDCYLAVDFDVHVMAGDFEWREGKVTWRHRHRPLDDDEAVTAALRGDAEHSGRDPED